MTRHHDLDALRAVAMLLGIVLHAVLFLLHEMPWAVHDECALATAAEANPYFYLTAFIHGFRMPAFFLLSGFFTSMMWQSRGLHRLVQHRLRRIGLPLLVSMFTIVPITEWVFAGDDFDPLAHWPTAWLWGLRHLWFLWYLLLLAAAFVVVRLGPTFRHPLWWLLVPLAVVPQALMQTEVFGADLPPRSMLPPPHLLGYYATFFFFGAFFHRRGIEVRRWWAAALPPAVLLVFPAGLALLFPEAVFGSAPAWASPAATVLQVAYAWLMCAGLMGLFGWIARKERVWVRYMADSSYWLYLWHLPLVILGQRLAVGWPVGVHLKAALLCVVVVAVLLAVYQTGVRYTAVGTMLNGPRVRGGDPAPGDRR